MPDPLPKEIFIRRVNYQFCIGFTSDGLQCTRPPGKTSHYCRAHLPPLYPKPTDCPICLEQLGDGTKPLVCGHWVHRSCLLQWKDQCPICRRKIKLTKKEKVQLRQAQQARRTEEADQLDIDAIIEIFRQELDEQGLLAGMLTIEELDEEMEVLGSMIVRMTMDNLSREFNRSTPPRPPETRRLLPNRRVF